MARKKKSRKKGISVTVVKWPVLEKLKRGVKSVKRVALNLLAVVGLIAVVVWITRAL